MQLYIISFSLLYPDLHHILFSVYFYKTQNIVLSRLFLQNSHRQ